MADECVVCGEAVEGKPLYKKLGSGEHNIEVMAALRTLQLLTLPDSAKTTRYICWDCDEIVVNEYGRFLEQQQQHKKKAPKTKSKQGNAKKKIKERKTKIPHEMMQKSDGEKEGSYRWVVQQVNPPPPSRHRKRKIKGRSSVSGEKRDIGRDGTNSLHEHSHHTSNCLMCGNSFDEHDESHRGYFQRHSLKKMVNDDLDVGQVMEVLGLARRIEPRMKARRFICNPCYIIIRRNYKNKLLKGSSIVEDSASAQRRNPIHRATTEEHAAEIARLLPPDLVECYKILTKNPSARYSNANDENYRNAGDARTQTSSGLTNTPCEGYYGGDIQTQRPNVLGGNKWDTSLIIPPVSSSPKAGNRSLRSKLSPGRNKDSSGSPRKHLSPGSRKLSLGRSLGSSSPKKSPRKNIPWGRKGRPASLETDSGEEIGLTCRNISPEMDSEVEEDNMNFSQDEHGNYIIEVKSSDDAWNSAIQSVSMQDKMNKRNVLLPRRSHEHLNNCSAGQANSTPLAVHCGLGADSTQEKENAQQTPSTSTEISNLHESSVNGTCNICGISFAGKTQDWWYSLMSSLVGFDSITINMALKVLETQLAHTTEAVRTAQQVCQPCYSMVSTGFKSQVVQRFAKQKNLKASQVDLSRVKIRMLPREKNITEVKEHLQGAEGEHIPGVVEGISRDQREHFSSWKRAQRKKNKKEHIDNDYQAYNTMDGRHAQRVDHLHHLQLEEGTPLSRVKKQRVSDDYVYDNWNSDDDFEEEMCYDSPKKKRKRKSEDKVYIPNFKYNKYDEGEVNDGLTHGNTHSDSVPHLTSTRPYQRTVSLLTQGKKPSIKNRLQDRIRNKNIHRYQTVRTLGAKSSVSVELGLPKRKRGRPRKNTTEPKRPRGRPRKHKKVEPIIKIKRPRGRPSKQWKLKEAELLRAAALAGSMQAQNEPTVNGEDIDGVTKMQHMQIQYSTIAKQAQQSALLVSTKDSVHPQYAVISAERDDHMQVAAHQNLLKGKKILGGDGNTADIQEASEAETQQHHQRFSSTKPIVLLKDLKFLLPREAFGGKAVSALKIEDNMSLSHPEQFDQGDIDKVNDYRTICDPIANQDYYSPLQSVFNSLAIYRPIRASVEEVAGQHSNPKTNGGGKARLENVCGSCVVCGLKYMMEQELWHHIDEYIKPPRLLVSLQWVCVSLSVQPTNLPQEEKEKGKVCNQCFQQLVKRFAEFVQAKVGESCGLPAHEVSLDDYLITFNSETYNLEADPKERSYVQEIEDAEQLLLQHILPLLQQFSIDQMVATTVEGTSSVRQPVMKQQFNLWLLLVLNELRVQIGADLTQLISWIEFLMPSYMYDRGLRPCSKELTGFLRRVSCSPFSHELSDPIPEILFTLQLTPNVVQDKEDLDGLNAPQKKKNDTATPNILPQTRELGIDVLNDSQAQGEDIHEVTQSPGTIKDIPQTKKESAVTPNVLKGELNNIGVPKSGVTGGEALTTSSLSDGSVSSLSVPLRDSTNKANLDLHKYGKQDLSQILADRGPKVSVASKDAMENTNRSPVSTVDFIGPLEKSLHSHQETIDSDDLPWEKYLDYINLDDLIIGKASPIPAHCMTQGLMYAIWQVSRLLAEGDQLVVDWVKQLSPVDLNDSQLQSIVTAIGSLQSHIESHPNDVSSLEYEVIPLFGCSNMSSESMNDTQGEEVLNELQGSKHSDNTDDSKHNDLKYVNSTQCTDPQLDTQDTVQQNLKQEGSKLSKETNRRRRRRKRKRSESQQTRSPMKLRKIEKNVSYVFESSELSDNPDVSNSVSPSVQSKSDRKLRKIETKALYTVESSSTLLDSPADEDSCSSTTLGTRKQAGSNKSESLRADVNSETVQSDDDENYQSNSTRSHIGDGKQSTDVNISENVNTTSSKHHNKGDNLNTDIQNTNLNNNDCVQSSNISKGDDGQTTDPNNEIVQTTDINRNDNLQGVEIKIRSKQPTGESKFEMEQGSTAIESHNCETEQESIASESDICETEHASTANECGSIRETEQGCKGNESDSDCENEQLSTANESDNDCETEQAGATDESDSTPETEQTGIAKESENDCENEQTGTTNDNDSESEQESTANGSDTVHGVDNSKSHSVQATNVDSVNIQMASAEKGESVHRESKNIPASDVSNNVVETASIDSDRMEKTTSSNNNNKQTSTVQTTVSNSSDQAQNTVEDLVSTTAEILREKPISEVEMSSRESVKPTELNLQSAMTHEDCSQKENSAASNPEVSSMRTELSPEKIHHETCELSFKASKDTGSEGMQAEVLQMRTRVLDSSKEIIPKIVELEASDLTPEFSVTTGPGEGKSLDSHSLAETKEPTSHEMLTEKMQHETSEMKPEVSQTRSEVSPEKINTLVTESNTSTGTEESKPIRPEVWHEKESAEAFGPAADISDSNSMVESDSGHIENQVNLTGNDANMNESNINVTKKDLNSHYSEIKMSDFESEVTENVEKLVECDSSLTESKAEIKEKKAKVCETEEEKTKTYSISNENVSKVVESAATLKTHVEEMDENALSVTGNEAKQIECEDKLAVCDSTFNESKGKLVEGDSHVSYGHSCKSSLTSSRHKQQKQEDKKFKSRKTLEKCDAEEKLETKRSRSRSELKSGKTVKLKQNIDEPSLHHSKPSASHMTSCQNTKEKKMHPVLLGQKNQGTSSDSLKKSNRPVERKSKLSFEELMNYDVRRKAPK